MTPSAELARLEKLIPPEKLAALLRHLADRVEERQHKGGGHVVLDLHFDPRGTLVRVDDAAKIRVF